MALELFKPTLWSRRFIVNTDKALVFKQVVDTSYEGEIQAGQVLKINEIGDIDISSYSATGGVTWQDVDDAQRELVIDQKKSFAFAIDDVDQAQMNVRVMDGAMQKAAFAMADTIDQHLADKYTEAGITNASNLGSASAGLNLYANDMPDLITYMHRYLKENNAMGRPWCVAPPWFMQLLRYAQITNGTNTFDTPNSPALEGMASGMGFDFYESNNVAVDSTNSEYAIMFGTSDAIAYAGQVDRIEAIRREDYFADGVRGLYIYGSKVVRPDHLGVVYANFTGLTS
jgi:hypothetical protein